MLGGRPHRPVAGAATAAAAAAAAAVGAALAREAFGKPVSQRGPEALARRKHKDILLAAKSRSWPALGGEGKAAPVPPDDLNGTPGAGRADLSPFAAANAGPEDGDESSSSSTAPPPLSGIVRCRLRAAYDGSRYHGWERFQGAEGLTVARVLDCALSLLTRREVRVRGASRTDAGVHARGQAAHFDLALGVVDRRPGGWPIWERDLNYVLPSDIRVHSLGEAPPDFDAIACAAGKTYVYRLHIGACPMDPMERLYRVRAMASDIGEIAGDASRLQEAVSRFVGRHDFKAFSRPDKRRPKMTTIRTVSRADVVDEGGGKCRIEFDVDGALWRMVRSIVGCTLAAAGGRVPLHAIDEALAEPENAGPRRWEVAKAAGLCLERVHYRPEHDF